MADASRESSRDAWMAWFVANPRTKILSFLLAMAAWVYVQGDEIHEELVRTQIQWELPNGLVTTAPLPDAVMLRVRGTRAATRRAEDSIVRMRVDLAEFDIGEHAVDLGAYEPVGVPQAVQVIGVEPAEVRFKLDEEAERKVVLRAVVAGSPAAGFEVRESIAEPSVVHIRGPRSVVESLDEVGTQPIDVSGMSGTRIRDADLDLPTGVALASGVVPTVEVRVAPAHQVVQVSDVPVYVWEHPEYQPEVGQVDVTLEGPSDQLRGVSAERVFAFVHVPEPPTRKRYEAEFGPQQGVRVRIVHPGGDDVRVTAMSPNLIPVTGAP